jgi:general secretion pathway protein N
MNDGGLVGLAAIAFGLFGVIGLEVLDWQAMPEEVALVRPLSAAPAGAPAAQAEPSERRVDWLNTILARPLFSPNRRPAASGSRSVGGLPRLAGIVVTGSRKAAIFAAPPGGGRPVVADEGMRLGAYDVKAISEAGVTVVGPEGTTVLRPIFDSAPPPVGKTVQPARAEASRPSTR